MSGKKKQTGLPGGMMLMSDAVREFGLTEDEMDAAAQRRVLQVKQVPGGVRRMVNRREAERLSVNLACERRERRLAKKPPEADDEVHSPVYAPETLHEKAHSKFRPFPRNTLNPVAVMESGGHLWSHASIANGELPDAMVQQAASELAGPGVTILGLMPGDAFQAWWASLSVAQEKTHGLRIYEAFRKVAQWQRAQYALVQVPKMFLSSYESGMPTVQILRASVIVRTAYRKLTLLGWRRVSAAAELQFRVDGLSGDDETFRRKDIYSFAKTILGLADDAAPGMSRMVENADAINSRNLQSRVARTVVETNNSINRFQEAEHERREEAERQYWASPEGQEELQRRQEAWRQQQRESQRRCEQQEAQEQQERLEAQRSRQIRRLRRDMEYIHFELGIGKNTNYRASSLRAKLATIESELRQLGA